MHGGCRFIGVGVGFPGWDEDRVGEGVGEGDRCYRVGLYLRLDGEDCLLRRQHPHQQRDGRHEESQGRFFLGG
jgi:hypothetical protein